MQCSERSEQSRSHDSQIQSSLIWGTRKILQLISSSSRCHNKLTSGSSHIVETLTFDQLIFFHSRGRCSIVGGTEAAQGDMQVRRRQLLQSMRHHHSSVAEATDADKGGVVHQAIQNAAPRDRGVAPSTPRWQRGDEECIPPMRVSKYPRCSRLHALLLLVLLRLLFAG